MKRRLRRLLGLYRCWRRYRHGPFLGPRRNDDGELFTVCWSCGKRFEWTKEKQIP